MGHPEVWATRLRVAVAVCARVGSALVASALVAGALRSGGRDADDHLLSDPATTFASSTARHDAIRWLPGEWPDYAPSGMPDFSQCRPEWSRRGAAGEPGQWTFAGPAAVADALWWLDSVAEPDPRPPGIAHDGHALVTFYPVFGPVRDDHDVANLRPLIEDMAFRADTDGRRTSQAVRGTRWEALVAAARDYIASRRLAAVYAVDAIGAPDAGWIGDRIDRGSGIVLGLGVWELQDGAWRRVGGHVAAIAGWAPPGGADPGAGAIALSDPLADGAALGESGRAMPPGPDVHSCRTAPRAHDDAAVVSHDAYDLAADPPLPGGRRVLDGYFMPATYHEAAAFQGQNPPSPDVEPFRSDWRRGPVVMAIDAALAIVPAAGARPTATAITTATSTSAATGTATESVIATETSTAMVTAVETPTGTPSATEVPTATATIDVSVTPETRWRVWLPWASVGVWR